MSRSVVIIVILLAAGVVLAQDGDRETASRRRTRFGRNFTMLEKQGYVSALKLTAEQKEKIDGIVQEFFSPVDPNLEAGFKTPKDFRDHDIKLATENFEKISAVLDEAQRNKFLTLRVNSLTPFQLLRSDIEVISALKLTEEQQSQLETVFEELLAPTPGDASGRKRRSREEVVERQGAADDKALAILTEARRMQFDQMTGDSEPPLYGRGEVRIRDLERQIQALQQEVKSLKEERDDLRKKLESSDSASSN
jgi:hypothetical protein